MHDERAASGPRIGYVRAQRSSVMWNVPCREGEIVVEGEAGEGFGDRLGGKGIRNGYRAGI